MQKVNALVFLSGSYMDKIVESVQVIMENKLAYVANGSVYCDTKAFKYVFLLHLDLVKFYCCDIRRLAIDVKDRLDVRLWC